MREEESRGFRSARAVLAATSTDGFWGDEKLRAHERHLGATLGAPSTVFGDTRRDRWRLCEPWEMNLRVPDVVANAAAACGADGWLRDLPGLIAELEAEWSVSVGQPFPNASEAFVAEASLADGTPAVLKLLIPQDGAVGRHEITMLRLTGGRGCVGLLRDDAARGALLLERLGPSLV